MSPDNKSPELLSDHPWETLPAAALDALAPQLEPLADEIIAAIRERVPAYAVPLEGAFGAGVGLGVRQALAQFGEMARERESPGGGRGLYVALGRGEAREGRSLESLLAAYRVGARVAWRRLAAAGLEAGLASETMLLLAESIFAYIDELSAESAEGYAQEQARSAGEVQRRREALAAVLVQTPPPEAATLGAAAEEAGWPVPRTLAVVALPAAVPPRRTAALPAAALIATVDGVTCVVLADPDAPGRPRALQRALHGTPGGVGPTVAPEAAARSFQRARSALALATARERPGLLRADEHRLRLVLARDPELVDELATECLAPLRDETPRSRERLESTLLAWLRHDGHAPSAAAELFVHPQTVRYRLSRLRELFGDALDDPDARFGLELALRARAQGSRPPPPAPKSSSSRN